MSKGIIKNIQFSSTLNNVKMKEWDLNANQGIVLDWIHNLHAWSDHKVMDGDVWYFAFRGKFIEDIPYITKHNDTVYRYFRQLEEKGLIDLTKVGRRDYVKITDKGKTWRFIKVGNKSELEDNSEINPSKLGNKSESNSEINPIDYNTIKTISINDSFEKNKTKKENQNSLDPVEDEKKKEKKSSVQKKKKFGKAEFKQILLEHGANEQHIDDWFVARDVHKATYTRTALNGVLNECSRNNFEVSKAIKYLAENGYRGFKYAWYLNSKGKTNQQPKTDYSNFRHNR